jgi:hypothetical protein
MGDFMSVSCGFIGPEPAAQVTKGWRNSFPELRFFYMREPPIWISDVRPLPNASRRPFVFDRRGFSK